ncbi:hypothetical protein BDD12DRAFT_26362 [Trichophaea hybrida]|nr:hypothetical protein BDD12DRAFT_26362 [Trichophaea hybrida]
MTADDGIYAVPGRHRPTCRPQRARTGRTALAPSRPSCRYCGRTAWDGRRRGRLTLDDGWGRCFSVPGRLIRPSPSYLKKTAPFPSCPRTDGMTPSRPALSSSRTDGTVEFTENDFSRSLVETNLGIVLSSFKVRIWRKRIRTGPWNQHSTASFPSSPTRELQSFS